MKAISSIIATMSIVLLASCEKEIGLPLKSDGGRLYLECFPSNGHDTTYISLAAALPATEYGASAELSNISIDFKVNGVLAIPEFHSKTGDVYNYIVEVPLETGDEVSLAAGADGYPSVTSVSYIPEGADIEMTREIYNYGTLRHRFTVHREDNSGEKRYYGIVIIGERRMETTYPDPEKEQETEISRITFKYKLYSPVQPSDAEVLDYETIVTCPVNGTDMVLFEDDGGKTPDMEVIVDIPYDRDKYWEIGPEKNVFRRTLYLVKMFSVTPQAYDYLNPKINESLLFAGLVPPFISYGNVDGGYGLNAGMGCISSGWMENLVL